MSSSNQDDLDRHRQTFFNDVVEELTNNLGLHRRSARTLVFRHADAVLDVFAESQAKTDEVKDIRDPERRYRRRAARIIVIRAVNCHQREG